MVKRDALDAIFSNLIRERNDYTCEACGKNYRHDTRNAHCAHIHTRKHRPTRWHVDGALCLCAKCHRRYTDFPLEWQGFVRGYYGDDKYESIKRLAWTIRKYTRAEKDEMKTHYRAQLKYMEKRRAGGEGGYIDFVGYD